MAVENYASKANLSSILTKVETKLANRYTKAETTAAITSAIAGVTQFDYTLVDDEHPLPSTGTKGVIYLVENEGSGTNIYDEYIWIVIDGIGQYEKLGWQELDLSGYLVGSDVKVNTSTLKKTADQSGNGFTVDLSDATKASLALADSAVQDADLANFLVGSDVKVDGTTITKTADSSGNGFTLSSHAATTVSDGTGIDVTHSGDNYEVALDSATQASLALADSAVQDADLANFLVGTDVKSNSSYISKTADQSGNGFTFDLASGVKTSLGLADTALQPSDVEPLSTSDVNDLLAILTTDDAS